MVSDEADLALLQADPAEGLPTPLPLATETDATPGARILLIGYPGGLGHILGRGAASQLAGVPGSLNFNREQFTQALASRDLLEPFISCGYLSNVSRSTLTLAAQTSDGNSGSPVLDEPAGSLRSTSRHSPASRVEASQYQREWHRS